MDNLTHTLTGLALGRAGLNRLYSRPLLVLLTAANLPDIDVAAMAGGPLFYFEHHREFSHSLVFMPVLAILPVLLALAISRSTARWKQAYLLALLGVGSHLLLDWTNAYGIRLFLPFSGEWLHADINSIVDIWIWMALLLAAAGPLLGRLVSSEIGAKPGSGRGLALFALTFFVLYDVGRYELHERAISILNSRIYEGGAPTRVGAFPGSVNPMRWIGWVDTATTASRFELNLLGTFDPAAGSTAYKPEPDAAMQASKTTQPFRVLGNFALYPLWSVSPTDEPSGGTRVELRDERFPFTAIAIVDGANRVQRSWFHF